MYIQDGMGGELRLLVTASAASHIQDPQMAPDGSAVAYVRDDELYVVSTTAGEPRQLTSGAETGVRVSP